MEQIVNLLDKISNDELSELSNIINDKLESSRKERRNKKIIKEIENKGYHCRTDLNETIEISELNHIKLPLYIDIYTKDREDKEDIHVDGLSDKQEKWFKFLDFEYEPCDNDVFDPLEDWVYGDWDSPITGTARMTVYVYYKVLPCPKEGTKFQSLDEDGNLEEWQVLNGFLLSNEKIYGTITNWKKYQIFILPGTIKESENKVITGFQPISINGIAEKLQKGYIERFTIDECLQNWTNEPNTILTFYSRDGIEYIVNAKYDRKTNQIFVPV